MPGMINSPRHEMQSKPSSAPAASGPPDMTDPMLQQKKQEVESKLPGVLKPSFDAIVAAGMRILFSEQSHEDVRQVLSVLKERGHRPDEMATAMVNLLTMIYKGSKGKMKIEAAYPAAVVLLMSVLQYIEATQGFKVTPDFLKAVGKAMANTFVQAFKIDTSQMSAETPAESPAETDGNAAMEAV